MARQTQKAQGITPEPLPSWVKKTPEDIYYDLTMVETYGGATQEISLTRTEFIALKAHLAVLRGFLTAT